MSDRKVSAVSVFALLPFCVEGTSAAVTYDEKVFKKG